MSNKNNMTLRLEKMTMSQVSKNQISQSRLAKKKSLQEKGITLIALVVTIIILLILAGVTLNIALSDGGLFNKTQEAADKYKTAQKDEEDALTELEKKLEGYTDNKPSPSTPTEPTPEEIPLVTTFNNFTTKNEEAKDSLGNLIMIPKGFKFAGKDGDTVKEGIVIQDSEGNEFVWIPVSNIDGDNNAKTGPNSGNLITIEENNKVEITLGRYEFNKSNGEASLIQNGSKYAESGYEIESFFKENTKDERTNGGSEAYNLREFVDSVQKNHGYYIARYEAGKKEGEEGKPVSKAGQEVWTNITEPDASTAAKKMYNSTEYTSDLVNSYAWDTAIVYIQETGVTNYANKGAAVDSKKKTGETSEEEKCHIYDMAGNMREWTTEYSTATIDNKENTCVLRGGAYSGIKYYTANRAAWTTIGSYEDIGFRTLLYLK